MTQDESSAYGCSDGPPNKYACRDETRLAAAEVAKYTPSSLDFRVLSNRRESRIYGICSAARLIRAKVLIWRSGQKAIRQKKKRVPCHHRVGDRSVCVTLWD